MELLTSTLDDTEPLEDDAAISSVEMKLLYLAKLLVLNGVACDCTFDGAACWFLEVRKSVGFTYLGVVVKVDESIMGRATLEGELWLVENYDTVDQEIRKKLNQLV